MAFVRLTNLGNLTLQNLLRIKERYGPNHELKRRRWAKLWEPQEDMDTFQRLFTSYHAGSIDQIVVRDGDSFYIKQRSGSAYPLTSNKKSLDRFKALGLISFSDTSMSFDRMVGEVENDRQTNPALTLGTVHVELTGMCNSDCTYCHRGGPKPSEYGLSVGMIKDGLNPLLRAGIELVVFTGGEPTLRRDDTLELISYSSRVML